MIITCPSCDAQYMLPDDAVGEKGRRVKCTTCAFTWTEYPEAHQPEPVLEGEWQEQPASDGVTEENPEVDPIDPFKARRERMGLEEPVKAYTTINQPVDAPKKDMILKTLGIAALLIVLTIGSAVAMRFSVVSWWPPMALFYETIGLPAPAPGAKLELNNVKVGTTGPLEKGGLLQVSGTLANPTKKEEFLSNLRVRLNGEGGVVLKDWDIDLGGKTLPAGKEASFQYSLKDAPPNGKNVTLLFID